MKALLCRGSGGPRDLVVEEVAPAAAGRGELVVAVRAAALNFFDTLIVRGKYQAKPELPFSPGAEIAGAVRSVGSGVTGFEPGDRVIAYLGWGGAREEVVVAAAKAVPIPDGISDDVAATLHVTYGTAIHALADRARIMPGDSLAILGAAGGAGQAAIEVGNALGARVIACASSDDKLEFCRAAGAGVTINTSQGDLKESLKRATQGEGVDVIFDPVGGPLAEPAFRAIAWGGRYLVIGFAGGDIPKLPLNLPLLKGASIVGVFWGDHVAREAERCRANLQRILGWAAQGTIRPHVHRAYRLDQAAEAFAAIEAREVKGKIVLHP